MSDIPRTILTKVWQRQDGEEARKIPTPGGFESRKQGCLCTLVRENYRHPKDATLEKPAGYYGHGAAILYGGKAYFQTIINEECPWHGKASHEIQASSEE